MSLIDRVVSGLKISAGWTAAVVSKMQDELKKARLEADARVLKIASGV